MSTGGALSCRQAPYLRASKSYNIKSIFLSISSFVSSSFCCFESTRIPTKISESEQDPAAAQCSAVHSTVCNSHTSLEKHEDVLMAEQLIYLWNSQHKMDTRNILKKEKGYCHATPRALQAICERFITAHTCTPASVSLKKIEFVWFWHV